MSTSRTEILWKSFHLGNPTISEARSICETIEFETARLSADRIERLKRDNAELLADKERIDWLSTVDCDSPFWVALADSINPRTAIDAARAALAQGGAK